MIKLILSAYKTQAFERVYLHKTYVKKQRLLHLNQNKKPIVAAVEAHFYLFRKTATFLFHVAKMAFNEVSYLKILLIKRMNKY